MNNPLLEKSKEAFGAIPFHLIKQEHFIPALKESIEDAKSSIDEIVQNDKAATFENTILALETSGEFVNYASGVYFTLFYSHADSEFQKLSDEISPLLADYSNDIMLNKELFKRVDYVYENCMEDLNDEDSRLLELTYKSFTRNGAKLSESEKSKLREIDSELSVLSPKFANNVLAATNDFQMFLNQDQLGGLPDMFKESAKAAAIENGRNDSWLITLQMPSMFPFMKYSNQRELRQKLFLAFTSRCNGGKYANNELIIKIVDLSHKRAKILGYDTYADYVLENRMAENQDKVFALLDNLYNASYDKAVKEIDALKDIAKELDGIEDLCQWDASYYSEKLRQKLYNFDADELRPYFKSENVINGVFDIAKKLYGLNFKQLDNIPTYHEEVKVYDVTDSDGSHIGLLYEDLYPRSTKKGGAWMNELRSQGLQGGKVERPHVSFTCNLTKSTESTPSLLTYDEVTTIFHEFGHCLHGLLSNKKYMSVGGTSVLWDFVELPSQIMENWVGEKEALQMFATHYETGEVMPSDLIEKINKSKNFMSATACLRQLSFAYLDMNWYGSKSNVESIEDFESNVLKKVTILPRISGTTNSCAFSHIFAGGYSAGYYSYKWAEVLEADAFEKFKEDGIFNAQTAHSFRSNILSQGNSKHPMELYKQFRGKEPTVDALLKRDGLN